MFISQRNPLRPTLPLPGGPPHDEDPDNTTQLPVEPDGGSVPPPALPEEEGPGWTHPV